MFTLGAVLLLSLLKTSVAQDPNCDFAQNVSPGQTRYVCNKEYARNYTPGVQCRWIGTCSEGYNCVLNCEDITLPDSKGCTGDRLLISRSGDVQLSGADVYCGRGTLRAVSKGRRISVGLITTDKGPGGRFCCELFAQLAPTDTNTACTCGYKKSNRIVGGQETGVNEFPCMAGVVYVDEYKIKCGGTIISRLHVLTAAHCLYNKELINVAVVVGEHDVTTGADTDVTQGIRAARFIIHPEFSLDTLDYDIALIQLDKEIAFSESVGACCLPYKYKNTDLTGKMVTVLGWGTQFIGGPDSKVLRKVDLELISQSQCRQTNSRVTSRQVCTYTPGKDACQDDSGGPALYTDPTTGRLFVYALTSYGRSCATAGEPGVYTRISEFIQFIESSTHEKYCVV